MRVGLVMPDSIWRVATVLARVSAAVCLFLILKMFFDARLAAADSRVIGYGTRGTLPFVGGILSVNAIGLASLARGRGRPIFTGFLSLVVGILMGGLAARYYNVLLAPCAIMWVVIGVMCFLCAPVTA